MVGYVFLVSTALEPLSCSKDVSKKWYMLANPQQECNWCTVQGTPWYNKETRELSYPALATLSYFVASMYSVGIPTLFFYIMYSHRKVLRLSQFSSDYGFLTSKTSEVRTCLTLFMYVLLFLKLNRFCPFYKPLLTHKNRKS